MRVLIIVDDYLPHSIKVAAKMMHDLAVELVEQGNYVTVVTPKSDIKGLTEISFIDKVKVIYFRSGPIKNVPFKRRFYNELLLSYRAFKSVKWGEDVPSVDLIVSYSPSIFWGSLVRKVKSKYNAPNYLILRDIFPQWVIDSGIISERSAQARVLRYFEKINYKAADRIGLMSTKNLTFFTDQIYTLPVDAEVLYNWAAVRPHNSEKALKSELGLSGKVIFFYGGAISQAQGIEGLVELAISMQDIKNVHFLFLGKGDAESIVRQAANLHENISFHESVSQEKYIEFLDNVDVGMFSLNRHHQSHNFPGKLLGYMNANLPIVGIVNNGNDLVDLVRKNNSAYVFSYRDINYFYEKARELALNEQARIEVGASGKKLLLEYFSVSSAAKQILALAKK